MTTSQLNNFDSATYKAVSYSTTITSNVSHQLNVDRNQSTVTFDSDGGSGVGNQTIYYVGKVTKP